MTKQVIEKFLKLNGETCPAFQYENPLLDKDVAKLFAKCIVKLLNDRNFGHERQTILNYVRDTCKPEPAGHLCVDDNITEILQESYAVLLKDLNNNTIDTYRALDAFLIRSLKEVNISSIYEPRVKPEILKALANLKGSKDDNMKEILMKDVIYWNIDGEDSQYNNMLKSLWDPDIFFENKMNCDDLSIKNKSEIEKIMLTICKEILEYGIIIELDQWLLKKADFVKLFKMCAVSSECFQICCSIMTSLLIMSNFDIDILNIIQIFIENVKDNCIELYFSLLYPINLQHIVVLLDINVNSLHGEEYDIYIDATLKQLRVLHNECESDFIMLLSHFTKWFDLYYDRVLHTSNE